jgi:hypothetical protein
MDVTERAQQIIGRAEKELAALAAEALAGLDYASANMLSSLAQRVAGTLRTGVGSKPDSSPAALAVTPSASKSMSPVPQSTLRGGKSAGGQYPRFKRDDETLIKIGWSKSDRATYEHKSPRSILSRLVARIIEVGSSGDRFTTEQILPLFDDDNAELPSYQAYLCLAWLVVAGLLERHGRQGYTIDVTGDFQSAVDSMWDQLPRR